MDTAKFQLTARLKTVNQNFQGIFFLKYQPEISNNITAWKDFKSTAIESITLLPYGVMKISGHGRKQK